MFAPLPDNFLFAQLPAHTDTTSFHPVSFAVCLPVCCLAFRRCWVFALQCFALRFCKTNFLSCQRFKYSVMSCRFDRQIINCVSVDCCALICEVSTIICGLLGRADQDSAIGEKPATVCPPTQCNIQEDLKMHQNRYESLKYQVASLLSATVRRTDDLWASCHSTHVVEM